MAEEDLVTMALPMGLVVRRVDRMVPVGMEDLGEDQAVMEGLPEEDTEEGLVGMGPRAAAMREVGFVVTSSVKTLEDTTIVKRNGRDIRRFLAFIWSRGCRSYGEIILQVLTVGMQVTPVFFLSLSSMSLVPGACLRKYRRSVSRTQSSRVLSGRS
ncbi:uncharacterized protein LAESUDRAFT_386374 [Laetiporus sulphureus 93-53]|uniref:Uncharacterized protein n=1 Tax=Laetiporus sulphureus 93-53 TaxID=1314785 RepID=A0A165CJ11_9APHY|nr:uncharacterized protein LAESUDRAFT_386374 [Laetiporus sulphureus 93-53]KZT02898.1 hypothetical protein LAESUDRAFT_386374 [Laetiporus sulphureus 93-53]